MNRILEQYKHLREKRKEERKYKKVGTIWKCESIYVDIETGEIIVKNKVTNGDYIKTNTEIKYKTDGNIKRKEITNECKPSGQGKFF